MTNIYVRSTDGADADDGLTWPTAKASADNVDGATFIDAAGDTVWLSQAHAESTAAALTLAFAGTPSSPSKLLCGNDAAEPPTTLAETASIATTGASSITVSGSIYAYGVAFSAGSGSSAANLNLGGTAAEVQRYDRCAFALNNTSASSRLSFFVANAVVAQQASWNDCTLKFGSVAQTMTGSGYLAVNRASITSGSATPTALVTASRQGDTFVPTFNDCDFSNFGTALGLIAFSPVSQAARITFNGCELPDGWTGSLFSGALASPGIRGAMYNCWYGATKIYLWEQDYAGSVKSDTAIYRTGGAAIGAIPLSMKMTTSALASYPLSGATSNWMERAYPGTAAEEAAWVPGATKTVSVEFVHDTNVAAGQGAGSSGAFQNNEFVLEVVTLDTNGSPIGTTHSSAPVSILAAAADIPSSSETWTIAGITAPAMQKLSVSIAPQEKGTIRARIIGYKASKEIYYCPKITVS